MLGGRTWAYGIALTYGVMAHAQPYGPAAPIASKLSPAQKSIALYRAEWAHRSTPPPCPRAKEGEIVVCGDGTGRSFDRLPLPEERGAPDWARTPTGEVPSAMTALTEGPQNSPAAVGDQAPLISAVEKLLTNGIGSIVK